MANIIIPLEEAIRVFQANVALPGIIRRIEATAQGPRVVIRLSPVMREFGVTIRFVSYENGVGLFLLDGLPGFFNLNSVLKPPAGITIAGNRLEIRPGTLLGSLGLKGLAVQSFIWREGAYHIETSAA